MVGERKGKEGWFDVSTLKEPFRIEGKRPWATRSPSNWAGSYPSDSLSHWRRRRPDRHVEGLRGDGRNRVDFEGKAPQDDFRAIRWLCPQSLKHSMRKISVRSRPMRRPSPRMRVPKAYGDFIILDILRQSEGTAVAVSDDEIMQGVRTWQRRRGSSPLPKAAPPWPPTRSCQRRLSWRERPGGAGHHRLGIQRPRHHGELLGHGSVRGRTEVAALAQHGRHHWALLARRAKCSQRSCFAE